MDGIREFQVLMKGAAVVEVLWESKVAPGMGGWVRPEYYDAAALAVPCLPFPSPVNDAEWRERRVEWFTEGETGMEVGPGRGEFVEAVLRNPGCLRRLYVVDMSAAMLDSVCGRVRRIETGVDVVFIRADVSANDLRAIPEGTVDRLIMINVFQDIRDPRLALANFRRLLHPSGEMRFNVSDRQCREGMPGRSGRFFCRERGLFFITRYPASGGGGKKVAPLGYIVDEDGRRTPFYRVQKAYYASELRALLRKSGFFVVSEEHLVLSEEVWLKSVAADGGRRVDPELVEFFRRVGGYPAGIEVVVMPAVDVEVHEKKGVHYA